MIFVFPGQKDVLRGKTAFRSVLDDIGHVLPLVLEVTGLRHCAGDDEVVSLVEWKSDKIPEQAQAAVEKKRYCSVLCQKRR